MDFFVIHKKNMYKMECSLRRDGRHVVNEEWYVYILKVWSNLIEYQPVYDEDDRQNAVHVLLK